MKDKKQPSFPPNTELVKSRADSNRENARRVNSVAGAIAFSEADRRGPVSKEINQMNFVAFEFDPQSSHVPIDDVVHGTCADHACNCPDIYCYRIRTGENAGAVGLHMHEEPWAALVDLALDLTTRARGAAGLWKIAVADAKRTDPVLAHLMTAATKELERLADLVDDLETASRKGDTMYANLQIAAIAIEAAAWRELLDSFGSVRSAHLYGRDSWLSAVYDLVRQLFTMFTESNDLAFLAKRVCTVADRELGEAGGVNVQ